ncbi:MAG: aldehyde ferredoxin oxidoreductase [Deltaproteobacteria bacterium]|nr:aldehyde ferredoxin oxidoreductase [Deltaproteobacteria bacterium]MBW2418294.1 aldehyde ferredoxin oxidoreductase [Deltaproteobacteria bacterium]
MSGGPTGDRMLRVDMTTQTVSYEDFPEEWKLLGGRGLSAKILTRDCDPTCDPLGPDNVLVMAPGVLAGTAAPTSGRISIGGKSPLTGGIKEANSGGNPGQHLMKLGIRAVIVTGQPADSEKRYGLELSENSAEVVEADAYKGMWNYACCEKLLAAASKTASAISIGPAGELRMTGASVACTDQDKERRPARHAARGGLGAVMGSKGLKWVLVDPGKLPARKAADSKGFSALGKSTTKAYQEGPQLFKHGTSAMVPIANVLNTFVYKNRTEGQSPDAQTLDGARIVESFEERGGGMHNCMTGCIVQCSNIVHDAEGNYKTSALEFETLTLLGSSCAVQSWEDVADLDRLCDELGLDTIETGAALAVLMDSGGMEWGDAGGMKKLLEGIADGGELGKAIGDGAVAMGKKTGHKRVPHARGQAIPAWDPRPLKATGVSYATSPMGADHTAGLIVNPALPPEELARASQESQLVNAVCDSSGLCQFLQPNLDDLRSFYTVLYGEEVSRQQIADMGWEILKEEWAFNAAAGFTAADDCLSDDMVNEGIGPDNSLKFDVDAETIAATKVRCDSRDELFEVRASG